MQNFWQKLPKPFSSMAPMADVTDIVWRDLVSKYGQPDVLWTEFVSADGLNSPGRENLLIDLAFTPKHRPIVAQIFSSTPENIFESAKLCKALGFDGVDINMGCPDRSIIKQRTGVAHLQDIDNALAVIEAALKGADPLPVSLKTRLGFNEDSYKEWAHKFATSGVSAITIHGRNKKQLSKVPADWEKIKDFTRIVKEANPDVIVIGNGDVESHQDGLSKASQANCDGYMVGRAVFGNPWFFNTEMEKKDIPFRKQIKVMIEHAKDYEKRLPMKSFHIMKKHFRIYINGFPEAKNLRVKVMESQSASEIEAILKDFLENHPEI